MKECFLCIEEKEFFTIGKCNHICVCISCSYKCRVLNNNRKCLYCNLEQDIVVITNREDSQFDNFSAEDLICFKSGIYYHNNEGRTACLRLENFMCPTKKCRRTFNSLIQLKDHLKNHHHLNFCDLCLENQSLLISEQKLYNQIDLKNHLERGEFDEDGNLTNMHPNCHFCDIRFFSEDSFIAHIKKEHIKCHLCKGEDRKWIYYNHYLSIEIHFSKSHFLCNYPECKEKCFVVFDSAENLERHVAQQHSSAKHRNLKIGQERSQKSEIMDNEGYDFKDKVK